MCLHSCCCDGLVAVCWKQGYLWWTAYFMAPPWKEGLAHGKSQTPTKPVPKCDTEVVCNLCCHFSPLIVLGCLFIYLFFDFGPGNGTQSLVLCGIAELWFCTVTYSPSKRWVPYLFFSLSVCTLSFKCVYYSSPPMWVTFLFWIVIGGAGLWMILGVCAWRLSPWSCLSFSCPIIGRGDCGPGLVQVIWKMCVLRLVLGMWCSDGRREKSVFQQAPSKLPASQDLLKPSNGQTFPWSASEHLKDELRLCCAKGRKAEEREVSLLLKPSLSALLQHKQLVSGQ